MDGIKWWYWNSTVYVYIILYSSTTSKRWIRWYRWILRHSTSVMGTSSSSAIQILPVEVTPLPWPHRTAGSHSTGKLVLIPSNWPKKSTLDIFRTLYICMYIYIHIYICMYNNNSVPCFCMARESLSSPKKILIYLLMYSFIYFCVCDGHVVNNMYNMCVCIHYIDYICK